MGHEVHIFSFNGDRNEKNVHVTRSFPLPMYTQYSVPFFPIPVALYRKALEERFDVIHIHDPFIGTLGYRVAKNQNIPIFSTFHTDFVRMQESINLPMKSRLFSFTWRYNLYLYRKCIMVFVPSGKSKRYLEEFGIHNTVELPLFVDTEKFSQLSESENHGEKFIVQFLGRITRDKGAFRLLDIASRIPESEGINFVISGTGPDEELLRKQVKERGLLSGCQSCRTTTGGRGHRCPRACPTLAPAPHRDPQPSPKGQQRLGRRATGPPSASSPRL
jgi:phosphatidylinositol alpha-mannosyltransferase